jgi:hypothetical protein
MSDTKTTTWAPAVRCDLTAGSQAFAHAVEKFRAWAAEQQRPSLDFLTTGWHTITPEIAEQLLICNRHNRKLRYTDVLRYATDMSTGRWLKTGEPVIITDAGDLEDAGHRCMACLFSGCSFPTFVVTGVPHDDQLFSFIDNGVSRTGDDTLHCAGLNGLSGNIQSAIKNYAIRYDEGLLHWHGRPSITPIANHHILDYAQAHPSLAVVAHKVADVYQAAIRRLDDKVAATFVGWKIHEAYGTGVFDEFMMSLTQSDLPAGHPVLVLQKRLDDHEAAKDAAPRSAKAKFKLNGVKTVVLAMRAFLYWQEGRMNVRRLDPGMDDPFPRIEKPEEGELAAAAQ